MKSRDDEVDAILGLDSPGCRSGATDDYRYGERREDRSRHIRQLTHEGSFAARKLRLWTWELDAELFFDAAMLRWTRHQES